MGFGGWGFGFGESIFCIGVLGVGVSSLAFCPEIVSCLVFRGEHRFKAEGRMGTGSLHPWHPAGAPGNKFDLASVVKEPVRQTNKVCHIANIDAVFGRMPCSWAARAHFLGIFRYIYRGLDNKKCS